MPDIKHMIDIKATPDAVYALIGTPAGLSKWWAEDVFDVSEGGCSLGFFDRTTVYRLRAESRAPGKQIVWHCESGQEWSGTRLIFDLQNSGKSTVLRFTHADWRTSADYFTMCNTTWGELMFRLMSAAQGRTP